MKHLKWMILLALFIGSFTVLCLLLFTPIGFFLDGFDTSKAEFLGVFVNGYALQEIQFNFQDVFPDKNIIGTHNTVGSQFRYKQEGYEWPSFYFSVIISYGMDDYFNEISRIKHIASAEIMYNGRILYTSDKAIKQYLEKADKDQYFDGYMHPIWYVLADEQSYRLFYFITYISDINSELDKDLNKYLQPVCYVSKNNQHSHTLTEFSLCNFRHFERRHSDGYIFERDPIPANAERKNLSDRASAVPFHDLDRYDSCPGSEDWGMRPD